MCFSRIENYLFYRKGTDFSCRKKTLVIPHANFTFPMAGICLAVSNKFQAVPGRSFISPENLANFADNSMHYCPDVSKKST